MKRSAFKIKLANALMKFKEDSHRSQRLSIGSPAEEVEDKAHALILLEKPTKEKDGKERKFQRYQKLALCEACVGSNGEVYPLCVPSTGQMCFEMHIVHGLPPKQCHTSQS